MIAFVDTGAFQIRGNDEVSQLYLKPEKLFIVPNPSATV